MDPYVTGAMIRRLREGKGLTQAQLAQRLNVSDKAVSRWETGRGYPDIALLAPLAAALGVSVDALFAGRDAGNANRTFRFRRMKFFVCPICGNVVWGMEEANVSCCGLTLPPLAAEPEDPAHACRIERVEDEYRVVVAHAMEKTHYISFIAAVRDDGCEIKKLYPEWEAAAYFKTRGVREVYFYCNRHGLFRFGVRQETKYKGGKERNHGEKTAETTSFDGAGRDDARGLRLREDGARAR